MPVNDKIPKWELKINEGKDFFFIFIVDCSGSMQGRRMEITIEAMKLFI